MTLTLSKLTKKYFNIFFFQYLAFTCGIVRGALANLGVTCVVTAEVTQLPACKFQIQVQRG